ncbi:hypothetical protein [Altericista sp. CCNU0014]|uniref:hypothetical protein n=1 Tax=Altericista sp. CCNU0014 TaxID=3082949 RepID=UPI00384D0DF9
MSQIPNWLFDTINSLNNEEKSDLLQDFIFISDNLVSIYGMPEPWRLIIDNQILIDLQHKEKNKNSENNRKRYIRLIAIFMIFNFLLNYSEKQIEIVLTPCIFYEFNQREIPGNLKIFNSTLEEIFSLIREFGVERICYFGLDNYRIARSTLRNISYDEKEILKLIKKLKKKEMQHELYYKFPSNEEDEDKLRIEMFRPPLFISQEIVSRYRINLRYFDRSVIRYIVACHLEDKIYSTNTQTNFLKSKMKKLRNISIGMTASISKARREQLQGLADIEMIQYCNISRQFDHDINHTLYPLTFDKKLAHLLKERTKLSVSVEISGKDSDENLKEKMADFEKNYKRMDLINENGKEMFEKFFCFYEDLTPLFDE